MKRAAIAVLALILLSPLAAVLGGGALLDSAPVRERVIEAAARATGHAVRLDGRLGLAWSLIPEVEANGLVLLNGPGFSRPEFATVRRIRVSLALLPLLSGRVEVPSVVLEAPDVLLERDAAGRGNWLPPAPSAAPGPAAPPRARTPVEVGRIELRGGRVAGLGMPPVEIGTLAASPGGGPVEGNIILRGVPIAIGGSVGALDRAPVPLKLSAVGGGVAVTVVGEAAGALAVQALVPDLAAAGPLAGLALPALKDVALSFQAGPGGMSEMHLTAGVGEVAGVRLTKLDAAAAAMDQPVKASAEGFVRALPIVAALNLGSPTALLGGGAAAFQALVLADGGSIAAQGSVDGLSGQGLQAVVAVRVPELRRSGALAGVALPALRDLTLDVRLTPAPGGAGVLARGLRLTSAQGDVAGDLAIGFSPRPSLRGTLESQRLDLDALALPDATSAPAPSAPAPPAAPSPPGPLIPPAPLPFALLRRADADLRLTVAQASLRGAEYRAIEVRLVLRDGRLRIDPARMQAPGGPAQALFTADAAAEPPTATLTLRATGLDAAALLGSEIVSGPLDLDVDLAGAGADLRALALSAKGHAGIGLIDGEVENQALAAMFGPVLRAAKLPVEVAGRSGVRCLAARIDAAGAILRLAALGLDSARLRLEGEGAVNLVDDTLDMRLRPTVRIGPTGVAIPVRLTGPVRAPVPALERGAIAPGRLGFSIGGGSPDPCGPALTAARDGRAGPMPQGRGN